MGQALYTTKVYQKVTRYLSFPNSWDTFLVIVICLAFDFSVGRKGFMPFKLLSANLIVDLWKPEDPLSGAP